MRSVASARALRGSDGGDASVAAAVARGRTQHRDVRPGRPRQPGHRGPIVRRIHRRVGRRTLHRFFPVGHRRVVRRCAVRSRYPDAMREQVRTSVDHPGRAAAGSVGPTGRGAASRRAAAGSVGPTGTWADGPGAAAARDGPPGRPSPVAPVALWLPGLREKPARWRPGLREKPARWRPGLREKPARWRPGLREKPPPRPGGRLPAPGRAEPRAEPPVAALRGSLPEPPPIAVPVRVWVGARERRRGPPACGCC
jgi:hypothetical protein